uniref:Sulfotransferase domain-containing protein n=1 Tax=Lotharella globosa TaxID=91324 RepID=A0A7S4E238_9EUKA|mmetsp:Transcript_172/g.255  ORF Transcript_172/g.255 Transcript_172/m.255 type:complete len:400 (+) Transcript_172:92-1291(+)
MPPRSYRCHLAIFAFWLMSYAVTMEREFGSDKDFPKFRLTHQGEEEKNLVLVKTHKTGTNTLLNILLRFAEKRNLNVALPESLSYLGWPQTLEEMRKTSYRHLIADDVTPESKTFHVLGHHAIYNRSAMSTMVPNAKFLTIFRDPVSHFLSCYNYAFIERKTNMTAQEFAELTLEGMHVQMQKWPKFARMLCHNGQSFDLGLGRNPQTPNIRSLIADISSNFVQVLITDMFDETLLLLARALGITELEDLVYVPLNVRRYNATLSLAARARIRKLNANDTLLYEHFKRDAEKRVQREGTSFQESLRDFRELMEAKTAQCKAIRTSWRKQNRGVSFQQTCSLCLPKSVERECALMWKGETYFTAELINLQSCRNIGWRCDDEAYVRHNCSSLLPPAGETL